MNKLSSLAQAKIAAAKAVMVQVQRTEFWVNISKKELRALILSCPETKLDLDPNSFNLYASVM